MDPLEVFAQAARDLRRHAGDPTKVWLASSGGISRQALDDLLNGARKPRWQTVVQYVRACAVRAGSAADPRLFGLERWRGLHVAIEASAGGRDLTVGQPPPVARAFQDRGIRLATVGCHVLVGAGGVGKTQLARQAWDEHQGTVRVWTDGTSRDAIVASFAAAHAGVTGVTVHDETEAAKQFLSWLGRGDRRWLVVIDDLHAPGDLDGLWPPGGHRGGHTVVTTRRADDALGGPDRELLPVGVFTPAASLAYLGERLGPAGLAEGSAMLAEELEHLPLALAQSATFQLDRRLGCAEYLRRMAEEPLGKLLPEEGARPDGQSASVVSAWALSVGRADSLRPAGVARPVLELLSVLDPSGVPEKLLTTDPVCRHLGVSARDAGDGLHCLRRLSLVTYQSEPFREIGVHRVVHRVTREHLGERLTQVADAVADGLLALWPDERSAEVAAPYLRTNAHTVAGHCGDLLVGHPLLRRFVTSVGESGDLTGAVGHCATLYARAVTRLGAGHRGTLELRHDHVYWLGSSGERATARAWSTELVADCARLLGQHDELTLSARLYRARWVGLAGDAAAAVRELSGLAGDYLTAGLADHPDLLTTRADLAHFTGAGGDPVRAVDRYREVVAVREHRDGPDHPYTLQARNGRAFWTWKAGDVGPATDQFATLVEDCLRILGPFHRYTLGARGNLAQCRGDAGDVAAAVAGLEGTLVDVTQALGPEHPLAGRTRTYLANWRARLPNNV